MSKRKEKEVYIYTLMTLWLHRDDHFDVSLAVTYHFSAICIYYVSVHTIGKHIDRPGRVHVVKYLCTPVNTRVVCIYYVYYGSRTYISEDLTSLNVQTLNRAHNSPLVSKTWSWNGRIFALLNSGKKIIVKPFTAIQECDV